MLEGQLIRQRYQILERIGQGSFGITYLAEDKDNLNKKCVVKLLNPPSLDQDTFNKSVELFEREAKTLAELGKHDQIPALLAYFQQEDDFYLVQEYIEGHPLSEEKLPLSEDDVIDFLHQLLTILQEVHQKNVIHRDIKPSNLMRRSSDHKIILIDFGGIKNITQEASALKQKPATCLGTPGYMPPEQYNGKPCFASDIYSLGITAMQMLTGSLDGTIPPNINPRLIKILQKMTEMQWENRYQSADEVIKDLLAILPTQEISQKADEPEEKHSELHNTRTNTHNNQSLQNQNNDATIVVSKKKFPWRIVGSALGVLSLGIIGFFTFQNQSSEQEVLADLEQATDLDDQQFSVHFDRGVAHYELKEYDLALAEYSQAIEINPNSANAHYNRALVYHDLQEYDQAIVDYNKAIEINPNDADAYYNRGLIYYDLQEYDQASLDIEKASELYRQQGNQEAYENAQQVQSELAQTQTEIRGKITTSQSGTTQVVVPESWTRQENLNDIADLQIADTAEENYLIIISEPKSDFDSNISVAEYSDMTRGFILDSLEGVQLSEPLNFTINGNPALQYQMRGSFDGVNVVYWHTAVEGDHGFHQLLAWTLTDRLAKNEPIVRSIINSFQEN